MEYLTAKQFSHKWGISERRIIKLCKENRITGAIKNGMVWNIPHDTIKPSDNRSKISKYINTKKRVLIISKKFNKIVLNLIPLLEKAGYITDTILKENENINNENITIYNANFEVEEQLNKLLLDVNKYYNGLILIDLENSIKNKNEIIGKFANKMDCESSIVLVSNKSNLEAEKKLVDKLKEKIGVRVNELVISTKLKENIIINYDEIAEDALELLTKFKNTTGISITTTGGAIEFDKEGRTKELKTGEFYKAINHYFKGLDKESYLWCASTMLEDEWKEEPLEMQFRVANLEAANRGVNIDRIFIFSKDKIKEFKNNKTLKIYMQSNINTMFVDYDEILDKEPNLLKTVGNGWDGIDKTTLIVDSPYEGDQRGYISINELEVKEAYECFQELKKYAKNLKDILK